MSDGVQPTMTNSWRLMHLVLSQPPEREPMYRRVGALGDDAFEAGLAEALQQLLAIAVDMLGIADRALALAEQLGELFLALEQRLARQILAVELSRSKAK